MDDTLSPELLQKMDAYWRAANYLSVGQIYLFDNPLLREPLKLTHVKVIPFLDDKFDPLQRPAWDIISDSNSVPTRAFFYGQHIKGMTSALANVKPESLVPGQLYRVEVTAGKIMGQLDFRDRELSQ